MTSGQGTDRVADGVSRWRRSLERLAGLYGLAAGYRDGARWCGASDVGLCRVLVAVAGDGLGFDPWAVEADALDSASDARAKELAGIWLEPVTVCWDDAGLCVLIRHAGRRLGAARVRVFSESGDEWSFECELAHLEEVWTAAPEGGRCACRRVVLPMDLGVGYHRVVVEAFGQERQTVVLRSPRVSHQPVEGERVWGLFSPTYAIRTDRDTGMGDLTDLRALARMTFEAGGRMVGTLPMNAVSLTEPMDPSPYAPISRRFWNELLVDPQSTEEFSGCVRAREIVGSKEWSARVEALRADRHVDWAAQQALRRPVLDALAEHFFGGGGGRSAGFAAFVESCPDVWEYGGFRARMERERAGWVAWDSAALTDADRESDAARTHVYAQYAFRRQLDVLAEDFGNADALMYLDLPLGVTGGGYDTWRYRGQFHEGLAVGAPPDAIFPNGQVWGLPAPRVETLRSSGYGSVREALRAFMGLADCLRLDHIMGMHRLYVVPSDLTASDGVYLSYPAEEQHAVMNIESVRHGCRIVGENLGMVPEAVNEAMEEHGYAGMYVAQIFANSKPSEALEGVPDRCVASLNTHDMPPFAAWWSGSDIEDLVSLGLMSESEQVGQDRERAKVTEAVGRYLMKHGLVDGGRIEGVWMMRGVSEHLAMSEAEMVLLSAEDLWGERERQNVPGTMHEHRNWTLRWSRALEDGLGGAETAAFLGRVDGGRRGRVGEQRDDGVESVVGEA